MTDTVERGPEQANGEQPGPGVVIRLRLVAPGAGCASGTFRATGAVWGGGTAGTDWAVPQASDDPGAARVPIAGTVRMRSPVGELAASVAAVAHVVPATGVLTGGGTWTVTEATGGHDGFRASGFAVLLIVYDGAGTAVVDLALVGRVPSRASLVDRRA